MNKTKRSDVTPIDPNDTVERGLDDASKFSVATEAGQESSNRVGTWLRSKPRVDGYEILGEISRGGMGVVYRARQLSANRLVALKMILCGPAAGENQIARFFVEAKAAANLDHPGIVPVFDVGSQDGLPYYSMGLVEGQSLKEHLDDGVLPSRAAARLVLAIAQAIDYAHAQGTIHRDLKPGNILIKQRSSQSRGSGDAHFDSGPSLGSHVSKSSDPTRTWIPVITDFGLAKQMEHDSSLTRTDQLLGTPSYMAPEQAIGNAKAVDQRCDLYSLGAILYEMLTGRPPFVGANWREVVYQLEHVEPNPPSSLNRNVDRDLETICLKCLEKEPERRYQTGADLAAELQRYLDQEPILARPLSRVGRWVRWSRRNPLVATLAICTGAALLLGTTVSLYWASEAELRAREATRAESVANAAASEADSQRREATLQRDQAQQQLYQSLVNESRFLRLAKLQGWRALSLQGLTKASKIQTDHANLDQNLDANLASLRGELLATFSQVDCSNMAVTIAPRLRSVRSLDFTPDGKRLLSHGYDGKMQVWNVTSTALQFNNEFQEPVSPGIARRMYSPLGPMPAIRWLGDSETFLATSWNGKLFSNRMLQSWIVDERPRQFVQGLDIAREGNRIALGWSDGLVSVHDLQTGVAVYKAQATARGGGWNPVALSQDGRWLATMTKENVVHLDDLSQPDQSPQAVITHSDTVRSLRISQDGKRLVSGSMDNTARVYLIEERHELAPLIGHASRINDVAISPDAQWIATASDDGTARLWNARTSQVEIVLHPKIGAVLSVAFSPDGKCLATSGFGMKAYRIEESPLCQTYQPHDYVVTCATFHPKSPLLITTSGTRAYGFWHTPSAKRWPISIGNALDDRLASTSNSPHDTVISPDGRWLVSASSPFTNGVSDDYSLSLWDLDADSDSPRILLGHTSSVSSLGFSPTSSHLVSIDKGGVSYVWETATGKRSGKRKGALSSLQDVVFISDSEYLQAYRTGRFECRSITQPGVLREQKWADEQPTAMAYSDVNQLFLVANISGRVQQIDLASLESVRTVVPPSSGPVHDIEISHNGKMLAVGHGDGGLTLWDTESWKELINLGHNPSPGLTTMLSSISAIAFSPDDRYLALCRSTEELEVWDLQQSFGSLAQTGIGPSQTKRLLTGNRWPSTGLPKLVRGKPPSEPLNPTSEAAIALTVKTIHTSLAADESTESIYTLDHALRQLRGSREQRSEMTLLLKEMTELLGLATQPARSMVVEAHLAAARFHSGEKKQASQCFDDLDQRAEEVVARDESNPLSRLAQLIVLEMRCHCEQDNVPRQQSLVDELTAVTWNHHDMTLLRWVTQHTGAAIYSLYRNNPSSGAIASDQWTVALAALSTGSDAPSIRRLANAASQDFLHPTSLNQYAELIGTLKLPIKATDLDGAPFDWQQTKGKVVVVDVWAPWCLPCLRVNPKIMEWTTTFGEENFCAVSLTRLDGYNWDDTQKKGTIDRNLREADQRQSIQQFAAHYDMQHLLGVVDKQTILDLGTQYIPQLMVFDGDGVLRHISTGSSEESLASVEESIQRQLKLSHIQPL